MWKEGVQDKKCPMDLREKLIWHKSEVIFLIWFATTPVALAQGVSAGGSQDMVQSSRNQPLGPERGMDCKTGLMILAGTTAPAPLLQQERHEQTH